MADDVTLKFKADISDLRTQMQQATRAVGLARAEFKAASAGMDDWSHSSDGLSSKIKSLNDVLKQQNRQLDLARQEYEKTVAVYGENSAAADRAKKKVYDYEAAVGRTEKEIRQYNEALDDLEKESEEAGNAMLDAGKDAEKAKGGYSVLKNVMADLVTKGINLVTSAINNQMDAAISRVDAIHAYERTMRNLGFTEQEVAEASNELSDGIQGLPTTLPYIQQMQQQYTALTGDIDKATDLTLALNNATLASGAGQEEASRAAEHWYSILAAGKPEAEHWKEINKAMPAQMNQIAEAVLGAGNKSQDLFEAWKDGTVTTEQVEDALVSLNKQGGSGLASFEQQAQDASKGINTSLANIKTAITNTLAGAIEEVGYENITGLLDSVKNGIRSLKEPIANFVRFVIENKDGIIAAFAGITAGMVAMTAVTGIMGLIGSMKTLITVIKGAESATALLNAELAINPVALVVGGVVALTTAVVAYEKANKAAIEAEHGLTDEQQANVEAVNAQKEALDGLAEARESSVAAANGQASYLTALKEEYNGLIDANGKVKKGEEDRANFIITTLAEALGLEKSDIQDLIGANGQLSDSIDKVIESKQAEATLDAYNAEYEEALKGRQDAYVQQAQAMQDLEDRKKSFKATEEEYLAFRQNYDSILQSGDAQTAASYMNAHADLITAYDAEKAALEEAQTAYETATGTVVAYNSTIANYEGLSSAIISGDADKISDAMLKIQNGFITAETGDRASLERQVSDLDASITAMQEQVDQGVPGITQEYVDELVNLRDQAKKELDKLPPEAKKAAEKGGQEMADGTASKKGAVKSAATSLVDAAEKAFGRDFNGDGKVAGGTYASGISSQSGKAGSAADDVSKSAKKNLKIDSYPSGENLTLGYGHGIGDNAALNVVIQNAAAVAKAALNSIKTTQKEGSPSKLTYKSGVYFTQGYINGIASQQKKLQQTVSNLVTNAAKALHKMTGTTYAEAGQSAVEQFTAAIKAKGDRVITLATYNNEARLKDFDKTIAGINASHEKTQARLQKESDKKVAALQKMRKQAEDGKKPSGNLKLYKGVTSKTTPAQFDKLIKQEQARVKKAIAADKKTQEKLVATQNKYKEAYNTASKAMLDNLRSSIDDYEEKAGALIDSVITGVTDKYQKRYDALIDKQDNLINKLKTAQSLFTISGAKVITVDNIKEQTAAIKQYTDNLAKIKGKVSSGLFDEIAGLSIEEGNAYMGQLFAMSESELKQYVADYEEYQKTAEKASKSIYAADIAKVQTDYQNEIDKAMAGIPAKLEAIGKQSMKGFVDGMTYDTSYMDKNVRQFVASMVGVFKDALKIKSPSRVMFGIGEYTGEGFNDGLLSMVTGAKAAAAKIAGAVATPLDGFDVKLSGIRGSVPAGGGTTNNSVVNNYNLVQNNNSPKPLTALETYKARQRQINMVKVATQGV